MMRYLLSAAAVVGLVGACSGETIVLATVPDDDDAGTGRHRTFVKCLKNADCAAEDGEFCQLDRSDPPSGHCAHKPLFCNDAPFHPVCGESGISYFNDCYRRQAGETTAVDGECVDSPRTCDLTTRFCPTGSTCELLGGGVAGEKTCGKPMGRCWGIGQCPQDGLDDRDGWDECSAEVGSLRCVDTCTAILSGRPFARHERCR